MNGGCDDMNKQETDAMINKIHFVIENYKENFKQIDEEERYKWEAIGWYKQHWDIQAKDFAAMLEEAFGKTYNLLSSGMYFARKVIVEFAQDHPEDVRALFVMLHDETLSLEERYTAFRMKAEERLKELQKTDSKVKKHDQDLRAIMLYLTFEYPEKYYLFKSTMFDSFSDRVGFMQMKSEQKSAVWKAESFMQLCEIVLEEVKKDEELIELSKARLDESCYQDEALHLLTMDTIYYGSSYTEDTEVYWPLLEEYNPNLTKEDWKRFLTEIEMPDHPSPMQMLKALMQEKGEATCKRLSAVYGGNPSRYVGCSVNLGKRAKKFFNLPPCMDGEQERYFPIPFLGRYVVEDGAKNYSYKIRPELHEALKELDLSGCYLYVTSEEDDMDTISNNKAVGLNTILYGPPGTGKTYNTAIYAVAICDGKDIEEVNEWDYEKIMDRYRTLITEERIAFTTFHQSYGYEDFIEGIKPVMPSEEDTSNDVQYKVKSGVFKRFCERANRPLAMKKEDYGVCDNPTIWKVSLHGTGDNPVRTECLKNGHIRIGIYSEDNPFTSRVENSFINRMKIGDIVLSCYTESTIDAIGVITGDFELRNDYADYPLLRKVNWIVKGIQEDILSINGGAKMTLAAIHGMPRISLEDVYKIIEKYSPTHETGVTQKKENYVFIIDEINRGNISKIFGELITLIEESKRAGKLEAASAILPYSQKPFSVPQNVYIIGTMNTADRSIALMDTALRRRFSFVEMLPDTQVLVENGVDKIKVDDENSIDIGKMLDTINQRITYLYDREHTIGHAFFMKLHEDASLEKLAEIFEKSIIPLLQEYFYEDYQKIQLVLGDNAKSDAAYQFIQAKKTKANDIFKGAASLDLDLPEYSYSINKNAFNEAQSYIQIYE